MEKRKRLTFLFCLILCYSLFQLTARAQSSSQATVSSSGSITYPSSNVNLEVIPDDFSLTMGSAPQYAYIDTSVTHNGHVSIRVEQDYVVGTREVDGTWRTVHPGDHIVIQCWIKTSTPTDSDPYSGARVGADIYGGGASYIVDSYPHDGSEHLNSLVHWGSDWTLKTWDFIIPSTTYTHDHAGNSIPATQVTSIVVWLDARPTDWSSYAWFSDAAMYVNPA